MPGLNEPKPLVAIPDTPYSFAAVIGGNLVPARDRNRITRENPAHRVPVSEYPHATAEDVQRAIRAARDVADRGTWRTMSGAARAKILLEVARLIERELDSFRRIECLECGKPVSNVEREIRGAIAHWEYAATLARHSYGDTYDQLGNNQLGLILREPIGVIGMITPWNYPLLIISQKLPFAVALGCSAVIKPSELTSGSTLLLGGLCLEAGVPPGVVNVLAGYGDDVGRAICESPLVDMISFTGSTKVGKQIARTAADTLKKVSLELGGKSAHIVCADANLEQAVERVVAGATRNTGQACVSGSRLLLDRGIAGDFLTAVRSEMSKTVVGDPLDPLTNMGPLISLAQHERVTGYIEAGKKAGAAMWCGSSAGQLLGGYFVQPTVFTQVNPSMSIAQEEIFGPVLSVIEFDSIDEAIEIANGTMYGLSAGVWTRDLDAAFRFGRKLKAGTVEVNTFMAGVPELPLTGHGQSGLGHERGRFAVEEFTKLKTLHLQLA